MMDDVGFSSSSGSDVSHAARAGSGLDLSQDWSQYNPIVIDPGASQDSFGKYLSPPAQVPPGLPAAVAQPSEAERNRQTANGMLQMAGNNLKGAYDLPLPKYDPRHISVLQGLLLGGLAGVANAADRTNSPGASMVGAVQQVQQRDAQTRYEQSQAERQAQIEKATRGYEIAKDRAAPLYGQAEQMDAMAGDRAKLGDAEAARATSEQHERVRGGVQNGWANSYNNPSARAAIQGLIPKYFPETAGMSPDQVSAYMNGLAPSDEHVNAVPKIVNGLDARKKNNLASTFERLKIKMGGLPGLASYMLSGDTAGNVLDSHVDESLEAPYLQVLAKHGYWNPRTGDVSREGQLVAGEVANFDRPFQIKAAETASRLATGRGRPIADQVKDAQTMTRLYSMQKQAFLQSLRGRTPTAQEGLYLDSLSRNEWKYSKFLQGK